MAFLTQLATNTLSNQNIASALNVLTYTNTSRIRELQVNVFLDQIAGNGSYTCYATVQRAGSGSAYQESPVTTATVASGVTAIAFASILLTINATDVLKIWVLGLAGDTTTPDIIVDVNEMFVLTDSSGQVTAADVKAINAVATTSVTAVNANVGTTQPLNFTGTGASALVKTDVTDIATAAVNTASAQLGVNVVSQANIDFGALQKASLNAATPSVTVSDKTGFSLSTAGILAIWHQLTSAIVTAGSIGKLLLDNIDATISSRTKPADTQARVTLVDTVTTYTGNTPQTGDNFARIGVAGVGLTNLGDARIANLDATVSSRTKPADTQARVTLVDTTTLNTTTTNLTNAPTVGDFTATMKTSLNNATPTATLSAASIQAIWDKLTSALTTVGSIGKLLVDNINATIGSRSTLVQTDVVSSGAINTSGGKVSEVSLVDALTGYVAPLTALQTENAVWNAAQSSHVTAGSTGASLNNASSGSAPTVQQIVDGVWDEPIAAHDDAGSTGEALFNAGAGAGTGFYTVEIPCEVSGQPADGVAVRVTSDSAGANVIAQASSNSLGIAVVYLDAGTYYAFLQRGGDTFPNPTTLTIP